VVKKPAHVIEGAPDVGPRYRQADPHRTQDREVQADGAAIPRRRAYCLKPPDEATITWDHIIPISRGGTHSVGNLAPACKPCNSGKQSRTAWWWRRFIKSKLTEA